VQNEVDRGQTEEERKIYTYPESADWNWSRSTVDAKRKRRQGEGVQEDVKGFLTSLEKISKRKARDNKGRECSGMR